MSNIDLRVEFPLETNFGVAELSKINVMSSLTKWRLTGLAVRSGIDHLCKKRLKKDGQKNFSLRNFTSA